MRSQQFRSLLFAFTCVACGSSNTAPTREALLGANPDTIAVTQNLVLPHTSNGAAITWTSSNPAVLAADGTVHRPPCIDTDVTLTATIKSKKQTYVFTVLANPSIDDAVKALTFAAIAGSNTDPQQLSSNLTLLKQTECGVDVAWVSTSPAVTSGGVVSQYFDHPTATLTATLILGTEQRVVTFDVAVAALPFSCATWVQLGSHDAANGSAYGASPSYICTAEHLAHVAATGDYVLGTDLALTAPLKPNAVLGGTFDGQGHTITGLTINLPTDPNVGLFRTTTAGSAIKNLKLVSVSIAGADIVGALVASAVGVTITDVSVTGSVTGTEQVGGLVGSMSGGTITGSDSSATVNGTNDSTGVGFTGGIAGQLLGGAKIASCTASGQVNSAIYGGGIAGGLLAGTAIDGATFSGAVVSVITAGGIAGISSGSITNVTSSGEVTAPIDAGGILGEMDLGVVSEALFTGTATVTDAYAGGGLIARVTVGSPSATLTLADSASLGTVIMTLPSGNNGGYVGGLIGDAELVIVTGTLALRDLFSAATMSAPTTGVPINDPFVGGLIGGLIRQTTSGNSGPEYTTFIMNNVLSVTAQPIFGIVDGGVITATHCFWNASNGKTDPDSGCVAQTTAQLQTQATFTGFDFATVWSIAAGQYPKLRAVTH